MKKIGIIMCISGLTIVFIALTIWVGFPPSSSSIPESPSTTFEPIIFTGSDSKTTPPFEVTTDEWIIEWSYIPNAKYPEDADFNFLIYPRGETAWYVESVWSADTTGSTYSYEGSGEYYIKVLAYGIDSWEITISPA